MNLTPKSRFCRSRAFTLVELLIVIVIIAALASMVFPMVQNIRKSAGSAITVTNLRQIQAANGIFASDNGGFFLGSAPFGQGTDLFGGQTWFSYKPFVGMLGVKSMGADGSSLLPDAWGKNYPEGLKCGMDVRSPQDQFGKRNFTIAMNWSSFSHQMDGTSGEAWPWIGGKILQSKIKNPEKLIMFYESAGFWGDYSTRLDWKSDDGSWQHGMAFRNKGETCNVAFADGHVGSLTRKDVEKSDPKTERYFFWDKD